MKTQADVILGYMHCYIVGDTLTIDELVIAAKFRRRGYAGLLSSMSYLLQSTEDRNLRNCPLCTRYGYACKCITEVYSKFNMD